jgi:hypothetical protein
MGVHRGHASRGADESTTAERRRPALRGEEARAFGALAGSGAALQEANGCSPLTCFLLCYLLTPG